MEIRDLPQLTKTHDHILRARLGLEKRKKVLQERGEPVGFDWLLGQVKKLERDLEDAIEMVYMRHPLYPYLKNIKGLGTELGGKLIGWIEGVERDGQKGIACFDTLSRFWAYLGWGLPERRTSGQKTGYRPSLKGHMFKIARSFNMKGNQFYEKVYLPAKEAEASKFVAVVQARKGQVKKLPPGVTTELHIHQRAVRKMIKMFLGCLYFKWREIEGLPTRSTYAEEYLSHTTRYRLEDFYDKEG